MHGFRDIGLRSSRISIACGLADCKGFLGLFSRRDKLPTFQPGYNNVRAVA